MENTTIIQTDYNTGFYPNLKKLTEQPDCWFLKQQKLNEDSFITADTFLNGACGIFAMALLNIHGYPMYVLQNSPSYIHVFCKKDDKFIDIRGITNDFSLFVRPFNDKNISYNMEHIVPVHWNRIFQDFKTFYKNNFYELRYIAEHQIQHSNPTFYQI